MRIITALFALFMATMAVSPSAQELDGAPYRPGVDPDIDMYMGNWRESLPVQSHGSLVERIILTAGDPLKPPRKGAVLKYINRFSYASLSPRAKTTPTTLSGEQEVLFFDGGEGTITAGKDTAKLYSGIAVLVPAGLSFTIENTGDEPLTMYLISEPVPAGFRPNKTLLVKDENTAPIGTTTSHWCHIVKGIFGTNDGLGTLESVITVYFDPMTMGHPHSHVDGVEEVWTAVEGSSTAFIGKQIRAQHPGMGYMIPPDGNTPHSNINTGDKRVKMLYFARYKDHEVRK